MPGWTVNFMTTKYSHNLKVIQTVSFEDGNFDLNPGDWVKVGAHTNIYGYKTFFFVGWKGNFRCEGPFYMECDWKEIINCTELNPGDRMYLWPDELGPNSSDLISVPEE